MSRPVRPTRSAELDAELAALDYELERPGLGSRFLDELDQLVERIGEGPLQFPLVHPGVRRGLLRHFPYGVYFTVGEEEARIIAVLHLHRHSDALQNRL